MGSFVLHPVWILVWFLIASVLMVIGVAKAEAPRVHNACLIATVFAVSVAACSMLTRVEGFQLAAMFEQGGDLKRASNMRAAIRDGDPAFIWKASILCKPVVQAASPIFCSTTTKTKLTAEL